MNQLKSPLEEYYYNLLFCAIAQTDMDFPKTISKDIRAGVRYALSTLEEGEQEVLRLRYAERKTVQETAAWLGVSQETVLQTEAAAFTTLRLPGRWNYIRYGIAGYMRKRIGEEYQKGYRSGFYEGYGKGLRETKREQTKPDARDNILDLPIETMRIPVRAIHSLLRVDCKRIRDIMDLGLENIQDIRNIGPKCADQIARELQSYGIYDTAGAEIEVSPGPNPASNRPPDGCI